MKLVILDRDGVLNHDSAEYIKSAKEWRPIQGSLEAIARLSNADVRVVLATNQAGIGRGLFDYDDLFAIHDKMLRAVGELGGQIEAIFFCPHTPEEGCDCRKPKPGMLNEISKRMHTDLIEVPMVGDSWRDLEAARAAGAQPILVRTGNGQQTEREYADQLDDVAVYEDLAAAVTAFLRTSRT